MANLKRRIIFVGVTAILFLMFSIMVLAVLNDTLLRVGSPSFVKTITIILFPPDDLYEPLVDKKFNIKNSNRFDFTFKNKYTGKHAIGFFVDDFNIERYESGIQPDVEAKITCSVQGKIEYSHAVTKSLYSFLGQNDSGYTLTHYLVPNNLPIDDVVNCTIYFKHVDSILLSENKVRLYVMKVSDL